MKKASLKFDKAKVKKFFLYNVEKIVFGLSMLVVAGLLYAAMSTTPYEKTPDDLRQQITSAKSNMERLGGFDEKIWPEVKPPKFSAVAKRAGDKVPDDYYTPLVLGKNISIKSGEKRDEPEFLPPADLLASSGVGPFAYLNLTAPRPNPNALPPRQGLAQAPGAVDGGPGLPMRQQPVRKPPSRGKKTDLKELFAPQVDPTTGLNQGLVNGEFAGAQGQGVDGGVDMAPGIGAGVDGMGAGGGAQGVQAPPESEVKGVQWVCLRALVPHREQFKKYMEIFENAGYTDLNKDYPYYMTFLVQRADVTDEENKKDAEKLKWENLQVLTELERTGKWAVVAPEVVDPNLTRPELTFPLGPLLGKNWDKDAAHPKVPLLDSATLAQGIGTGVDGGMTEAAGTGVVPDAVNYEDPTAISDLERLKSGKRPRVINRGGGMGVDGDYPGAGMRGGSGRMPLNTYSGADGEDGGSGYGGRAGYGGRTGYGGGYAGGMSARGRGSYADGEGVDGAMMDPNLALTPEEMEPEYLLLRFFDFNVKEGRTYRYRVQLVIENPNEGVRPQFLKDAKHGKETYRLSPWSEPSPVVSVSSFGNVLAGPVAPAKGILEPEAKVICYQYDKELGVKAVDECRRPQPKEKKVMQALNRGQLLRYTANIDVVHPLTHQAAQTEMEFNLNMTMLDLTGGEPFNPDDKYSRDKIPGELLFMDANGFLSVRSELEDENAYMAEVYLLEQLKMARENPGGTFIDGDSYGEGEVPGAFPIRGRRGPDGS